MSGINPWYSARFLVVPGGTRFSSPLLCFCFIFRIQFTFNATRQTGSSFFVRLVFFFVGTDYIIQYEEERLSAFVYRCPYLGISRKRWVVWIFREASNRYILCCSLIGLGLRPRIQTKSHTGPARKDTHRWKAIRLSGLSQTLPATVSSGATFTDPFGRKALRLHLLRKGIKSLVTNGICRATYSVIPLSRRSVKRRYSISTSGSTRERSRTSAHSALNASGKRPYLTSTSARTRANVRTLVRTPSARRNLWIKPRWRNISRSTSRTTSNSCWPKHVEDPWGPTPDATMQRDCWESNWTIPTVRQLSAASWRLAPAGSRLRTGPHLPSLSTWWPVLDKTTTMLRPALLLRPARHLLSGWPTLPPAALNWLTNRHLNKHRPLTWLITGIITTTTKRPRQQLQLPGPIILFPFLTGPTTTTCWASGPWANPCTAAAEATTKWPNSTPSTATHWVSAAGNDFRLVERDINPLLFLHSFQFRRGVSGVVS